MPSIAASTVKPSRRAILLAALALLGLPRLAAGATGGEKKSELTVVGRYQSRGRDVSVRGVQIAHDKPRPAVVLLYGANGLAADRPYGRLAAQLKARGILTFIPEFFDAVDGESLSEKSRPRHFPRRQEIILDGFEYLRSLPGVDRGRMGVIGFSLGAFHACAIASQDRSLKALVSVAGGMPRHLENRKPNWLPPTLIVHGSADTIVDPSRARALAAAAARLGAIHQVVEYPGAGHDFPRKLRNASADLAVKFLAQHLG